MQTSGKNCFSSKTKATCKPIPNRGFIMNFWQFPPVMFLQNSPPLGLSQNPLSILFLWDKMFILRQNIFIVPAMEPGCHAKPLFEGKHNLYDKTSMLEDFQKIKLFSPSEACRIFHFFENQFSPTFMCFVDDLHSKLLIIEDNISDLLSTLVVCVNYKIPLGNMTSLISLFKTC